MLILSGADLRQALSMSEAVATQKAAFTEVASGSAEVPLRGRLRLPEQNAVSLFMPARVRSGLGIKIVSVFPGNARRGLPLTYGAVLLLSAETGAPEALLDGTYLTALRTGAASAAATDWLARAEVRTAAVFGTGVQAETQLLGLAAVRQPERVFVVGRDRERLQSFVSRMQGEVRAHLVPTGDADAAVEAAEVICTATTSATPVFDGTKLRPGTHINGVGSFTLETREVDSATVRRAGRVFVDSREAALAEAGDVVIPLREHCIDERAVIELGCLGTGSATGRTSADEITFFKSVGIAVQDIAAAEKAVSMARALGLGTEVEL